MERQFDIGDRVICNDSGVIGKVLKFYTPTSCAEQTMVLTDDGRQYHAPTNTWSKYGKGCGISLPYIDMEKCAIEFADILRNEINKSEMRFSHS